MLSFVSSSPRETPMQVVGNPMTLRPQVAASVIHIHCHPSHSAPAVYEQPKNRAAAGCNSCAINVKPKIVRCAALDRHQRAYNRLQFAEKLIALLASETGNSLPLRSISKYRVYLGTPATSTPEFMIKRYPAVFRLFRLPVAGDGELAVALTPAAAEFAREQADLRTRLSDWLAAKLQKLLMLSSYRSLLLSKLARVAPEIGLPADLLPVICNQHTLRFKTVDTSYGTALQLVSWDPLLAVPSPATVTPCDLPIVDRPLKFHGVKLRKGLNLKKKHLDFLGKIRVLPDVNPYASPDEWPNPHTMEGEKRACGVVREILTITVEKTILVDILTPFRKELGLPTNLRGMLVRHPELFYLSRKGIRDSVLLVEGFDEKGKLVDQDPLLQIKQRLMQLLAAGQMLIS